MKSKEDKEAGVRWLSWMVLIGPNLVWFCVVWIFSLSVLLLDKGYYIYGLWLVYDFHEL